MRNLLYLCVSTYTRRLGLVIIEGPGGKGKQRPNAYDANVLAKESHPFISGTKVLRMLTNITDSCDLLVWLKYLISRRGQLTRGYSNGERDGRTNRRELEFEMFLAELYFRQLSLTYHRMSVTINVN